MQQHRIPGHHDVPLRVRVPEQILLVRFTANTARRGQRHHAQKIQIGRTHLKHVHDTQDQIPVSLRGEKSTKLFGIVEARDHAHPVGKLQNLQLTEEQGQPDFGERASWRNVVAAETEPCPSPKICKCIFAPSRCSLASEAIEHANRSTRVSPGRQVLAIQAALCRVNPSPNNSGHGPRNDPPGARYAGRQNPR